MSEGPSRRLLLALTMVGALAGCQMTEERLTLEVEPASEPAFLEAVRTFAQRKGFSFDPRLFEKAAGYRNIELRGWRTKILISGTPFTDFIVSFRHRDDWWLLVMPSADLAALLEEFRASIADVDGVVVRNEGR
jgi:hypothetical protein